MPEENGDADGSDDDARKIEIIGMSRSVRSWVAASLLRNTRSAIPKEPATMRNDRTMPNMPAVAIAPTPMKRT